MIKVIQSGGFENLERFFTRSKSILRNVENILHRYGARGVEVLQDATPVDTSRLAKSWEYRVTRATGGAKLEFHNTNIENGYSVLVLVENGHATRSGSFVEGRPFVDKTLEPILKSIEEEIGREVARL